MPQSSGNHGNKYGCMSVATQQQLLVTVKFKIYFLPFCHITLWLQWHTAFTVPTEAEN